MVHFGSFFVFWISLVHCGSIRVLFGLSFNCFDLFWLVLGKSESYFGSFRFVLAFFDLFLVRLEVVWCRSGYL